MPNSNNNSPSELPPLPPLPLPHSTPLVPLRPAVPTIRFHGHILRPPPTTLPLPLPGPRLGALATLHPRFSPMGTPLSVLPTLQPTTTSWSHSVLAHRIPWASLTLSPSRLRGVGRWCLYRLADEGKEKDRLLPPTTSRFVGSETSNRASIVSSSGSSFALTPSIAGPPFQVYVASFRIRTTRVEMRMSRWTRRICYTTLERMRRTNQEVWPSQRVARRYSLVNAIAILSHGAVSPTSRCSCR